MTADEHFIIGLVTGAVATNAPTLAQGIGWLASLAGIWLVLRWWIRR